MNLSKDVPWLGLLVGVSLGVPLAEPALELEAEKTGFETAALN